MSEKVLGFRKKDANHRFRCKHCGANISSIIDFPYCGNCKKSDFENCFKVRIDKLVPVVSVEKHKEEIKRIKIFSIAKGFGKGYEAGYNAAKKEANK